MHARVQYGAIEWDSLSRAIGCIALILAPFAMLMAWPSAFSPYMEGKTVVFRALSAIWSTSMLATLAIKPRMAPNAVWLYGFFALILGLADLAPVYSREFSFWGDPARQEGFIAIASYLSYFMALTLLPEGERVWKWIIGGWAISGVIMALASCIQLLNEITTYQPVIRAYGLIGNPVLFGDFLALTIIFTIWAARRSELWLAWTLAAGLQGAVLLTTATRSAMAGLLAGMFFLIPGRSKWLAAGAGIIGILLYNSQWHNTLSFDMAHRVDCAGKYLTYIGQHPLLGWGQDNLKVMCAPEVFDRAHNWALQVLGDGGALALGAYLAFLAGALKSVVFQPFALAIFAAYILMVTIEPDAITTTVPMLTALGWANRKYRAAY